MRVERLSVNKIKVFVTYDDLKERNLTKEDIWHDVPKLHGLFLDLIDEANEEVGFEIEGPLAVEMYSMPAQGMVIIVTTQPSDSLQEDEDEEIIEDEYVDMQLTLDERHHIFYEFLSFEDVISLSSRLHVLGIKEGTLYTYNGLFYLYFDWEHIEMNSSDNFIAILSEFGSPSTTTVFKVMEYGKVLMEKEAIRHIYHHFVNR